MQLHAQHTTTNTGTRGAQRARQCQQHLCMAACHTPPAPPPPTLYTCASMTCWLREMPCSASEEGMHMRQHESCACPYSLLNFWLRAMKNGLISRSSSVSACAAHVMHCQQLWSRARTTCSAKTTTPPAIASPSAGTCRTVGMDTSRQHTFYGMHGHAKIDSSDSGCCSGG